MSAQAHQGASSCRSVAASALLAAIALYRVSLGQLIGGHCRFEPSCSRYAHIAVTRHGALWGSLYTLRRLLSCHPWHAGGVDQVPTGTLSVAGAQQRDDK